MGRCFVASIALLLLCSLIPRSGASIACKLVNEPFPLVNDSFDSQCASIFVDNVTASGSLTLNLNMSQLMRINTSAAVFIRKLGLLDGAVFVIDARQLVPQQDSHLVITITQLVSRNGGLAIAGIFPAHTTIVVKHSRMSISAITSGEPPVRFLWPPTPSTFGLNAVAIINLTLVNNSHLSISDSEFSAECSNRIDPCVPLTFYGSLVISNFSSVDVSGANFSSVALSSSGVSPVAYTIVLDAIAFISYRSELVISNANLTVSSRSSEPSTDVLASGVYVAKAIDLSHSSLFKLTGGVVTARCSTANKSSSARAVTFEIAKSAMLRVSSFSFWIFDEVELVATAYTNSDGTAWTYALFIKSELNFREHSQWMIRGLASTSSSMSINGVTDAEGIYFSGPLTFEGNSQWLLESVNFSVTSLSVNATSESVITCGITCAGRSTFLNHSAWLLDQARFASTSSTNGSNSHADARNIHVKQRLTFANNSQWLFMQGYYSSNATTSVPDSLAIAISLEIDSLDKAVFDHRSQWLLSQAVLTAYANSTVNGGADARTLSILSLVTFANESQFVLLGTSMSATADDRDGSADAVTIFVGANLKFLNNAWGVLKSNTLSAHSRFDEQTYLREPSVGCFSFYSAAIEITKGANGSGVVSFFDNDCLTSIEPDNNGHFTLQFAVTGTGPFFLRCNRWNGSVINHPTQVGLPARAILVGNNSCSACNSSAECFTPLALSNSTCSGGRCSCSASGTPDMCLPMYSARNIAPTPQPSTSQPSTTEPSTARPSTIQPSTTGRLTRVPSTGLPSTSEPSTTKLSTAQPSIDGRSTLVPSTGLPSTSQPSTMEPSTAQPSTAGPSTSVPSTGLPSTAEPSTIALSTAQPSTIQMSTTLISSVALSTQIPYSSAPPCRFADASTSFFLNATVHQEPRSGQPLLVGNDTTVNAQLLRGTLNVSFRFNTTFLDESGVSVINVSQVVLSAGEVVGNASHVVSRDFIEWSFAVRDAVSNSNEVLAVTVSAIAYLAIPDSCATNMQRIPVLFIAYAFFQAPSVVPLRDAVDTTAVSSSAVSSVLGNPVAALQQAVLLSFAEIAGCHFRDDEPLDSTSSPTGLAVGSRPGAFYRGAAVVFLAVIFSAPVVAGLVVALLIAFKFKQGTPRARIINACAKIRFPSVLIIPVSFLVEGSMLSAAALVRLGHSGGDYVLSIFVMIVATAFLASLVVITVSKAPATCRLGPKRTPVRRLTFESNQRWQLLLAIVEGNREWEGDAEDRTKFAKHFAFLIDGFVVPWYMGFEFGLCLLHGLIVGVRDNSLRVCQAQSVLLLVVHVTGLMVAVRLLPCLAPLDNFFLVSNRMITSGVACVTVVELFKSNQAESPVVDYLSSVGSLLSTAQTFVCAVLKIVVLMRTLNNCFQDAVPQGPILIHPVAPATMQQPPAVQAPQSQPPQMSLPSNGAGGTSAQVLTVAASSSSPPVAPTAESSEEDPADTRSVDLAEESEMSEISADQSSLIGDAATDSLLPHVPQSDFFSLMEQPTEYEDALRQAYRARGDKLPVLTAAAAAAAVTQQEDEEPFEL